MASTNTTQAKANVTAQDFGGDEFANNLFTDLAPLLTLFGEQVTKQFLSLSMGWADNFLVAMAPLGIITIVVSSIRVTKNRLLKAIVGRARESRATAEAELLSSTSDEVCELFDGSQIVRVLGEPDTKEFVYEERTKDTPSKVWGLKEALEEKKLIVPINGISTSTLHPLYKLLLRCLDRRRRHILKKDALAFARAQRRRPRREVAKENGILSSLSSSAPNLILNAPNAVASSSEIWTFAVIGIISQLLVLVFGALTTYHWNFKKGGFSIASYGYPCALAGTIAVSMGLLLCSHVIEGSTDECNLVASSNQSAKTGVLRIQRACSASEQHFQSFALLNSQVASGKGIHLRTSRLNDRNFTIMAAVGSFVSISGFIVQFIGLRALHWSATIMQLGATVFMTCVRSYVRRGLAHDMEVEPIAEGDELEWLTEFICHNDGLELLSGAYIPHDEFKDADRDSINRGSPSRIDRPSFFLNYALPHGTTRNLVSYAVSLRALLQVGTYKLPIDPWVLPPGWGRDIVDGRRIYTNEDTGFKTSIWPSETHSTHSLIDSNSLAMEMINQRTRLSKMSGWVGPYAELARTLVAAMLEVREILENGQNSKCKRVNTEEISWKMKIISNPEDLTREYYVPSKPLLRNITFTLPRIYTSREDNDPLEDLRADIKTVLSLWLHTFQKRSRIPEWMESSAGLQEQTQDVTRGLRSYFLRIVSSEISGDTEELKRLQLLGQWLDQRTVRVPAPDGTVSFGSCEGYDGGKNILRRHAGFQLHHHPIFGVPFSSIAFSRNEIKPEENAVFNQKQLLSLQRFYQDDENVNVPPWSKDMRLTTDIPEPARRKADQTEREAAQLDVAPEILTREATYLRRKLQTELAVYSRGTCAQNCATEIFSCFFWAATENVEAILGTTEFNPGTKSSDDVKPIRIESITEPRSGDWDASWKNDVIDKIAKVLFDQGLVENISDGKSVIIAVLFKRGLFPTRESTARKQKDKTLDDWLIKV